MSDFKNITKIAVSVGGPIASLFLGPGAGAAISALGKLAGPILGLEEDDTEGLEEMARTAPGKVTSVVKDIAKNPDRIEEFNSFYSAQVELSKQVNETYRQELKSEGWIARNWRPIHGLELTVEMAAWGFLILRAVYLGGPVLKATTASIMELAYILGAWYSARLAVMGVHVAGRSQEKIASMTNVPGTLINEVIKAVRK